MRVQGSGLRVQGSGFRVQGLEPAAILWAEEGSGLWGFRGFEGGAKVLETDGDLPKPQLRAGGLGVQGLGGLGVQGFGGLGV